MFLLKKLVTEGTPIGTQNISITKFQSTRATVRGGLKRGPAPKERSVSITWKHYHIKALLRDFRNYFLVRDMNIFAIPFVHLNSHSRFSPGHVRSSASVDRAGESPRLVDGGQNFA